MIHLTSITLQSLTVGSGAGRRVGDAVGHVVAAVPPEALQALLPQLAGREGAAAGLRLCAPRDVAIVPALLATAKPARNDIVQLQI